MKDIQTDDMELPKMRIKRCHTGWLVVDAYLNGLEECASELMQDPEYEKRFDAMRRYTNLQLYGTKGRIGRYIDICQEVQERDE